MNKVVLIGNLVKNPELKPTPSGNSVCNFSIAVNRDYTDADGNKVADFFNITVWGNRAETCSKYLKKGSKVGIIGQLQNNYYEDKDGNKKSVTNIIAIEVEFLSPKGNSNKDNEYKKDEEVEDGRLPF